MHKREREREREKERERDRGKKKLYYMIRWSIKTEYWWGGEDFNSD